MVILSLGWPRDWSLFRIYDHQWRPLTPLSRVPSRLENLRGMQEGFIAEASYSRDRQGLKWVHGWVRIDREGGITQIPRAVDGGPIRAGEVVLGPVSGGPVVAVAPDVSSVRRPSVPDNSPRERLWQLSDEGASCVSRRAGGQAVLTWTFDFGRSWAEVPLREVTPARAVPRAAQCIAAGRDRLLVTESDQSSGPTSLHTLRVSTGTGGTHVNVVGTHRLNDNGAVWMNVVLPDGRALMQAEGGLMVATDPSNSTFHFRPGPLGPMDLLSRESGVLVGLPGDGTKAWKLTISTDAGATWLEVDLKSGSWAAESKR